MVPPRRMGSSYSKVPKAPLTYKQGCKFMVRVLDRADGLGTESVVVFPFSRPWCLATSCWFQCDCSEEAFQLRDLGTANPPGLFAFMTSSLSGQRQKSYILGLLLSYKITIFFFLQTLHITFAISGRTASYRPLGRQLRVIA